MSKFLSLLSFAAKAGALAAGEEGVGKSIKSGKALLVVLSADVSANTRKKIENACKNHGVYCISAGEEVMAAAGKYGRKVLAVTDERFAGKLAELYADGIKSAHTKDD